METREIYKTELGQAILNGLTEETFNLEPTMEIWFTLYPENYPKQMRGEVYVSPQSLKAGAIGRVYLKDYGAFSDLWIEWDEAKERYNLFIFASCERVPVAVVSAYEVNDAAYAMEE